MILLCLWLNRVRRPRLWADEWLAVLLVDCGVIAVGVLVYREIGGAA